MNKDQAEYGSRDKRIKMRSQLVILLPNVIAALPSDVSKIYDLPAGARIFRDFVP